MTGFLNSLTQIVLLRKDPSGLPSTAASVALVVVLYAAVDVVVIRLDTNYRIVARTAVDVFFSLGFFAGLLALTGRLHRFPQTIVAAFGAYVLLSPVLVALFLLRSPTDASAGIAIFLDAASALVVIWYLLIVGHVLRAALDTGLVTGFALAVAWTLASFAISQTIFGAPA
jgi:hypothetical protein